MRPPDTVMALRGQLEALSEVLGGAWALVEHSVDHDDVIATTEELERRLSDPDHSALFSGGPPDGVALRIGLGRRSHPAGRGGGESDVDQPAGVIPLAERILVGIDLDRGSPDRVTESLLDVVLAGLSAIADAADQAEQDRRRAERLELRASTDPLTGLLNRRGWDRFLAVEEDRCARHHLDAEVVVVDLDGLKTINDSEGHEAGDAVIVRAAAFIFSAVRIHDAVARLGGDEFSVLAVDTDGTPGKVGGRVTQALLEAGVAASVGSANRSVTDGLADAWRAADVRMYQVKQRDRRGASRTVPDAGP